MSTFGVKVVVDVPAGVGWSPDLESDETDLSGPWTRYVGEPGVEDDVAEALHGCPPGTRVALAEDFDEYGARFRVLRASGTGLVTVYQAYVLNADPGDAEEVDAAISDLEEDPRPHELTGPVAAAETAQLFGVGPTRMVQVDGSWREQAWQELGIVGGPFPWWGALELPW